VQVRGSMGCTDQEMVDNPFSKKLDHNPHEKQTLASSGINLEESCRIQLWIKKESRKPG